MNFVLVVISNSVFRYNTSKHFHNVCKLLFRLAFTKLICAKILDRKKIQSMHRQNRRSALQLLNLDMKKEFRNFSSGKVVPQNSLSDMISRKVEEQQKRVLIDGGQIYCPKCDNLNRNILYLENYLRSSILKEPCNSCSTCLSYLQYMKQTMPELPQQRKQVVQDRSAKTPILTDFYVIREPETYMEHAQKQQQSLPELIKRIIPKQNSNVPLKKVVAPRRPRLVEFPMSGQMLPKIPPRIIYNKRPNARKPASLTKKKKVVPKNVENANGNFEGVPPPKKMVKKKRAKATKGEKIGKTEVLKPVVVK